MEEYILESLTSTAHLSLILDGVDHLYHWNYCSDFFASLRHWHELRSQEDIWEKLDLVLATSTSANHLITNPHQSPFNVGESYVLDEFDRASLKNICAQHRVYMKDPQSTSPSQLHAELHDLIGGHPYLVRKALSWMATKSRTIADLKTLATKPRGPFFDHLEGLYQQVQEQQLGQALKTTLLYHERAASHKENSTLVGLGLIVPQGPRQADIRNEVYRSYFSEILL